MSSVDDAEQLGFSALLVGYKLLKPLSKTGWAYFTIVYSQNFMHVFTKVNVAECEQKLYIYRPNIKSFAVSISNKMIFKIVVYSYKRIFYGNVKDRNITPKQCLTKETRHRSIYAVWFYPMENTKVCKTNQYYLNSEWWLPLIVTI